MKNNFNYYSGTEFKDFLILPKCLFNDPRFSGLSYGAKLLYGLLLDRMSLSAKNGWIDKDKHIYIYFTVESIMELMGVSKNTCLKLFRELDTKHGCGLIIKKNQGLCKPAKLYVMDCTSDTICE